jgi:GNAT superfamily N-acetyltransferase
MVREDLANLPGCRLPTGFSFRPFEQGDGMLWAQIESSAGEFASSNPALDHFRKEFGTREKELSRRCLFLQTVEGQAIGTATAWYGTLLPGAVAGRLHWVAIRKEYQGRGLGKPLVGRAIQLLAAFHKRAYLTTQTTSYAAVKIYLDFGFKPYIINKSQERSWAMIEKRSGIPASERRYAIH